MSDGTRSMGPSKIGELARRAGCTVKAVRFYEASGLLPRAARSPSGYRLYPLARDHLSFPELLPDHGPHKVQEMYLIQWEQPQLVVDVTETMGLKLKAVACHASQVGDFQLVEARVRARSSALGKMKGYAYAEGFDHVVLPG